MDKKFIARSGVLSLGDVVTSGSFLGDGSGLSGVLTGVSASNGITGSGVSGDTIKLGGTLTENTTINGNGTYSLTLNNASVFRINTQPAGATTNTNIIFDVTANSASQRNRFQLLDSSGGSGTINEFHLNKGATNVYLQGHRNGEAGILNATSNGFGSVLYSGINFNCLGFSSNTAASTANTYFLLSGGTTARTNSQYIAFGSGIGLYSAGSLASWNPGGASIYARWHSAGTWIYTNRGGGPAHTYVNTFLFYATDYNAEDGKSAPHFQTEDGKLIKLYPQTAVTSSQGIADALTSIGLLSGSSVIPDPTPFPYTGSAEITGSLVVTGSIESNTVITQGQTIDAALIWFMS